jgi:hypothetical protein
MINHLLKLSRDLRHSGFYKESEDVDFLIKEAFGVGDIASWFRDKYNKLKSKFNRKKETEGTPQAEEASQEYRQEQRDSFEEVLQRKESGPPEGRLYFWYTHPFEAGCQICASRHGQLRTLAQWRSLGFPGRSNSSCIKSPNCNCFLIRVQPGGTPNVATNDDGKFNISDLIGIGEDNTKKNMQQGPMFTGEQFFNNSGETT